MRLLPAPEAKHLLMESYAKQYGLSIFVESGTGTGDSVQAARTWAREIHSVELREDFYTDAVFRFSEAIHRERIHLYKGDSAHIFRAIMPAIQEPALFWLDGHADGPASALMAGETPILKELELIQKFGKSGVVLIDDFNLFGHTNYSREVWPTLDELKQALDWHCEVKDDIVRFVR